MEESRDFDVFFGVFFFWHLEEKKKCREELGKEQILEKMCVPWSNGCLGLFIALGVFFKAASIVGPSASNHL